MNGTRPSPPSHFEGEAAKLSSLTHSCSSGYQCAHRDPPEHLKRLCPPWQRSKELAACPGWKSTPVSFLVKGSKASSSSALLKMHSSTLLQKSFFCLHEFLQEIPHTTAEWHCGLEKVCLHAFVKINAKLQKSPLSKDVGILDVSLKQTAMHSEQCSEQCSESRWGFYGLVALYSLFYPPTYMFYQFKLFIDPPEFFSSFLLAFHSSLLFLFQPLLKYRVLSMYMKNHTGWLLQNNRIDWVGINWLKTI